LTPPDIIRLLGLGAIVVLYLLVIIRRKCIGVFLTLV